MVLCRNVNTDILTWARKSAGLAIDDLKKEFGKVSAWESGELHPTYVQLEGLAKKYKRPLALFFFPEVPKDDIKGDFRAIPGFRADAVPTAVRFAMMEGTILQMNLSELFLGQPPPDDRFLLKAVRVQKGDNAKTLAAKARRFLEISVQEQQSWDSEDSALQNWRETLSAKGVFVFKNTFKSKDYSGFCLYDDDFPIIYINNSLTKTRQIFTLFHELAHLLRGGSHLEPTFLEEKENHIASLDKKTKDVEVFCNKFSSELLVPDDDFKLNMKHGSQKAILESVQGLAKKYRVSREVILRKYLDRGRITETTYREKAKEFERQATGTTERSSGGNFFNTKGAYLGATYMGLVFNKYWEGKITTQEAAEHLRIKAGQVDKLEQAYLEHLHQ